MTELTTKITAGEVYNGGSIKISALQRYMQTLATADSDKIGCTYDALRAVNTVFVITKLGLKLSCPIFVGDEITIRTYSNRVTGITFMREYEFYKNCKLIGQATTEWVLVRFDTRAIVRPRDIPFSFETAGNENSVPVPRMLSSLPMSFAGERTVSEHDLDSNLHMNNCVYSDVAFDFIPFDKANRYPSSVYIIFRHEARLGDILSVSVADGPDESAITAYNSTKNMPCFDFKVHFDNIVG